jgi:ankyrin repeat protein
MSEDLDHQLLVAANESNYVEVLYLTDHGANVNVKNDNGITPLMFACMNGNLDVVSVLIHMGADLNLKNEKGQTALMISIENNHYYVMIELFNSEADINIYDDNNLRAIDYYHNNFDQINQALFNLGFDNNQIMDQFNPFVL